MSWPEARPNEVVFGLAEGKVKIGQLKSNKPATLYNVDSFCASLATSPDGNGVVSAHADGTLYRFLFDDNGACFQAPAGTFGRRCGVLRSVTARSLFFSSGSLVSEAFKGKRSQYRNTP